jgi:uncharacterized membrane protein
MILAGVCSILGILILLLIPFQVSAVSSNEKTLGADFFPRFIGILLIVASIGLFVETYIAHRMGHEAEGKIDSEWKKERKVLMIFLMLVVYIVALQYIGFIVGSILFGVAMMYVLGVRTWWFYLIFIGSVFLVYYVFHFLLYVHLPSFSLFR